MNTAVQKTSTEPKFIEYTPFGAADKIKLNVEIVKRFICIATKSGKTCDDAQATKFMMLCQTQRLNPFAGDCFLAGYDGKNGPVFSLITAHLAFIKRAESCADYEGMESGIILKAEDGKVTEREGDFHLPDEDCVGGWARVFRKGRKPTYRRLSIAAMKPNYDTPFWSADKAAGQIVKCAEADALRATFPTLLGGLYSPEESAAQVIDVATVNSSSKLVAEKSESQAQSAERPAHIANSGTKTQQDELADLVTSNGYTFTHFQAWGIESGNLENGDSIASFSEVPIDVAKRLLRAKTGLLQGLAKVKELQ